MALRVLLADENVTIKKVIQLSLQDYAVTVKSVNLGSDVLEVARGFQPDLILADILLQKRTGYEVCSDLKGDELLKNIPVILMWSGFMELDQAKYKECLADDQIEKPFDQEQLRKMVQKHIEKTKEQSLSPFLNLPDMPKIEEDKPSDLEETASFVGESAATAPTEELATPIKPISATNEVPALATTIEADTLKEEEAPTPPPPQPDTPPATEEKTSNWDMNSFEEIEDYVEKPLEAVETPVEPEPPKVEEPPAVEEKSEPKGDEWVQKDLSSFKLNVPETPADNLPKIDAEEKISSEDFVKAVDPNEVKEEPVIELPPPTSVEAPEPKASMPEISPDRVEEIVREECRKIIEDAVWKVVPDLAERLIREELEKLSREGDIQP